MGFSRQEYWSGLPFPPKWGPDPGIEPESLTSPALAGGPFTTSTTWEAIAMRSPCMAMKKKTQGNQQFRKKKKKKSSHVEIKDPICPQ